MLVQWAVYALLCSIVYIGPLFVCLLCAYQYRLWFRIGLGCVSLAPCFPLSVVCSVVCCSVFGSFCLSVVLFVCSIVGSVVYVVP